MLFRNPRCWLGRRSRAVLALLALSNLVACAFSDVDLPTPLHSRVSTNSRRGHGRTIAVARPFADERPERSRCGMKKNGYNADVAKVLCDSGPESFMADLLANELSVAGFRVVPASRAAPTTPIVSGALTQYFVEPKLDFFGGAFETDIGLRLLVESKAGFHAIRGFYVKGSEATFWSNSADLEASNDRAVRTMLLATVGALANLMDHATFETTSPAAEAPPAPAPDAPTGTVPATAAGAIQ